MTERQLAIPVQSSVNPLVLGDNLLFFTSSFNGSTLWSMPLSNDQPHAPVVRWEDGSHINWDTPWTAGSEALLVAPSRQIQPTLGSRGFTRLPW